MPNNKATQMAIETCDVCDILLTIHVDRMYWKEGDCNFVVCNSCLKDAEYEDEDNDMDDELYQLEKEKKRNEQLEKENEQLEKELTELLKKEEEEKEWRERIAMGMEDI